MTTPSRQFEDLCADYEGRLPMMVDGSWPNADQIKFAIIELEKADFTYDGACEIVELAVKYGNWFLEHAAAVARAMNIEDGKAGF